MDLHGRLRVVQIEHAGRERHKTAVLLDLMHRLQGLLGEIEAIDSQLGKQSHGQAICNSQRVRGENDCGLNLQLNDLRVI